MQKIGVIGSGTMGKGVAQCLAQCGYQVILVDQTMDVLTKSLQDIERSIRMQRLFQATPEQGEPGEICSHIHITTELEVVGDAAYIIENITEDIVQKEALYRRMDVICKQDCIFMVNTSCISITQIAGFTKRPEKVVGTHFMNPVPMIQFVEMVRGHLTAEATIDRVKKFLAAIDKEPILVNDAPGFVSNRISHLMMNEAAFIVQDQVARPKDVDKIFRSCYGHKMGPLETADLIGLDTVVQSLRVLYEAYQDPKFRCCPLLTKMVHAGHLGRKSGKGFYEY